MYIHRSNRLLVPFVLFISILILNYNIIIINWRILKKTTTLLRTNSPALPPNDPAKKDGASGESAEVAEEVTPEKVSNVIESYTGKFIREIIGNSSMKKTA